MNDEVWRGSVRSWECDEMGHQNARFYFTQSLEGLGEVAAWLGIPSLGPDADCRLQITNQHSRFLKEAHDAMPLYMRARIVACGEQDAEVVQILYHALSDEPATLFSLRIRCVDRDGRPRPWPNPVAPQSAAEVIVARGLPPGDSSWDAADQACRAGVIDSGRGIVMPGECDAMGRMRTDAVVGRVSDATHLIMRLCEEPVRQAGIEPSGTAALECRLAYRHLPLVGTRLRLCSGVLALGDKTRRMMTWLLDSATGELIATLESIEIAFDLNTRKSVPWQAPVRAAASRMLLADDDL